MLPFLNADEKLSHRLIKFCERVVNQIWMLIGTAAERKF